MLHIDCRLCFPQGSQQGPPQQPGCVSARMTHTGRVPVPWGPEHTYSCGPHHPDSASEQDSGGELWKEDSSWGWTTVNGLKKRTKTCLCHEAISSCHQPLWKEEQDASSSVAPHTKERHRNAHVHLVNILKSSLMKNPSSIINCPLANVMRR